MKQTNNSNFFFYIKNLSEVELDRVLTKLHILEWILRASRIRRPITRNLYCIQSFESTRAVDSSHQIDKKDCYSFLLW